MIQLSLSAAQEIQRLFKEMALENQGLRFFIQGGCCGKSYGMGFDNPEETDHVHHVEGVKILVDPESAPYIQGLAIDFRDGGFELLSENTSGGCCSANAEGTSGGCCNTDSEPSSGGCCQKERPAENQNSCCNS